MFHVKHLFRQQAVYFFTVRLRAGIIARRKRRETAVIAATTAYCSIVRFFIIELSNYNHLTHLFELLKADKGLWDE